VSSQTLGYAGLAAEIVRDRSPLDPEYPTCSRFGCAVPASVTTLAGATRVPTCWRHVDEYLERYPEDAHLVWPVRMAT